MAILEPKEVWLHMQMGILITLVPLSTRGFKNSISSQDKEFYYLEKWISPAISDHQGGPRGSKQD